MPAGVPRDERGSGQIRTTRHQETTVFHPQTRTDTHSLHRALAATAAALVTLGLNVGPSFASPDPGPPIAPATSVATSDGWGQCSITRVGDQYSACDNLTGNGVAAPAWVPEL
jgi:hypothetical protein